MSQPELSNEQLSRYSRHILLPEIDLEGQQRLSKSRVLIIGAGGLGSPAAMYLASSGVGQITIFDDDRVDLGNLQRQIAFRNTDIGAPKASQLRNTLLALNPEIIVSAIDARAEGEALNQAVINADVIVDACDNFASRFAINAACYTAKKPLINGAAIRLQGQVTTFDSRDPDSPCYACLYKEEEAEPVETCRDRGVFAPLTGIIGSIQAAEAIKMLLRMGTPLVGRLLLINVSTMTPRIVKLPKDPHCPVCGHKQSD